MRRLSLITAVAVVIAVTGCATVEGYRQKMDLIVGSHSDQLQVDWGVPDRVTLLSDGKELWIYRRETLRQSGNSYDQVATGSYEEEYTDKKGNKKKRTITTYTQVWVPPKEWVTFCETRFVVGPDQKILSTSFEGPDCVAKEMKRSPAGE